LHKNYEGGDFCIEEEYWTQDISGCHSLGETGYENSARPTQNYLAFYSH